MLIFVQGAFYNLFYAREGAKEEDGAEVDENLNSQVFDFELTAEEMETLSTCGRNDRLFKALSWRSHPEYPFTEDASK
nr:unnamed protein product [Spirometra erinaceieuropaei]